MDCNICLEESINFVNLTCCLNSKQICQKCLDCLKYPVCPYCRTEINVNFFKNNPNIHSHSPSYNELTQSWQEFLNEETSINPYDYDNSRRLRRQIRKMRQTYINTKTHISKKEKKEFLRRTINEDILIFDMDD